MIFKSKFGNPYEMSDVVEAKASSTQLRGGFIIVIQVKFQNVPCIPWTIVN